MFYFPNIRISRIENNVYPYSISSPLFYRVGGERGGGCAIIIFFGSTFHFLSIRVSIAESNGSIFHFDSTIFSGGGGGGARAMIIIFFGSMFHFPSIGLL